MQDRQQTERRQRARDVADQDRRAATLAGVADREADRHGDHDRDQHAESAHAEVLEQMAAGCPDPLAQ